MMRRRSMGFFTLAAVALVAALPAPGMAAATRIVPGQAIGPARLGMSVGEARAVLGTGVQDGEVRVRRWGMIVTFTNGVAVRVSSTSALFRTDRGAGVGTRLDDVVSLVGDQNLVRTSQGNSLTVLFPFQGIGFVFQSQRAVTVFVEKAISLTPPAHQPGASMIPAPMAGAAQQSAPALRLRSLREDVDPARAVLTIVGLVANTGGAAVPVHIAGRFVDASGHETRIQTLVQQPIPPGRDAPFTLIASVERGVVVRYEVTATALGASGAQSEETRAVPPETYGSLARARLKVAAEIGAPSNTSQTVQVIVSVADTGPIPRAWVREVDVAVAYTGGQQIARVPGDRAVTVLIPARAQLGAATVQAVTLQAP
ncbi:MAG TPA: hypothetical protein VGZ23_20780 [bacterium]|nr:hypothetical protein [bacterium]